ncbi:hypothetical protein VPH35_110573 [Triticum aestivum]
MQIGQDGAAARLLFRDALEPLIAVAPPACRPSAPPKTRTPSAPELGVLDPRKRMTVKAAEALLRRFDEPLSEDDIDCIARLTRLDVQALCTMASLAGPDGAA